MNVGELIAKIKLDRSDLDRGLMAMRRAVRGFKEKITVDVDDKKVTSFLTKMGKFGGVVAGGAAALSALSAASSVAASGAMGLVAGVVAASGALWILPGAALAGGAAMAALKIGMTGFGDAMSSMDDPAKFAEAIAKLSPAARAAAVAVKGLQPAWKGLQMDVQERLFTNMGDVITRLGNAQIPVLRKGLADIAGGFNGGAQSAGNFLASGRAVALVQGILGRTSDAATRLAPAFSPAIDAVMTIGEVGSRYLPAMATAVSSVAVRFNAWARGAAESGRLNQLIDTGIATLKTLGTIAVNVGSILGGIFRAAQTAGGSFFQNLANITAKAAELVNSFEGQQQLAMFFTTAGQLASAFGGILGGVIQVIGAVGQALNGTFLVLGPAIQAVLVNLAAGIRNMAPGIQFVVQGVANLLTVLAPLLPAIGSFANGLLLVVGYLIQWGSAILSMVVPPLTWLIGLLGATGPMWAPIVAGIISLIAAYKMWQMAHTAAMAVINFAKLIATITIAAAQFAARLVMMTVQMTIWAAQMTARAAVAAAGVAMSFLRMAASGAVYIGSLIATAAATVAQWAIMAAGAMARAVVMAAAWLVAMGPVGIVIAIVIALVALIIANWDTIKNATIAAWNAVVSFVTNVFNRIRNIVMQVLVWMATFVVTTWARVRAAFQQGVQAVVSFVQQLPARIRAFFASAATWLINAGKAILEGLLNGLKAAWNAVAGWVGGIADRIRSLKGPLPKDRVLLVKEGKAIMGGLGKGMAREWRNVENQVKGYGPKLRGQVRAFAGLDKAGLAGLKAMQPGSLDRMSAADIAAAVEAGIRRGQDGAKLRVDAKGTARMVNKQNAYNYRLGSATIPRPVGRR